MTKAWVITDTLVTVNGTKRSRASGLSKYNDEIIAAQGVWNGFELALGLWLNKVSCLDTTLANIRNEPNWFVLDKAVLLTDPLSSLTNADINAISAYVQSQGFDLADFRTKLGSTVAQIKTKNLGQLLQWFAGQFNLPRWDEGTQTFVYDGPAVVCPPLTDLDNI